MIKELKAMVEAYCDYCSVTAQPSMVREAIISIRLVEPSWLPERIRRFEFTEQRSGLPSEDEAYWDAKDSNRQARNRTISRVRS